MKRILVITYSCDGTAKARLSRIHVHTPKCSNCGEEIIVQTTHMRRRNSLYMAGCPHCKLFSPWMSNMSDAVKQWILEFGGVKK